MNNPQNRVLQTVVQLLRRPKVQPSLNGALLLEGYLSAIDLFNKFLTKTPKIDSGGKKSNKFISVENVYQWKCRHVLLLTVLLRVSPQ